MSRVATAAATKALTRIAAAKNLGMLEDNIEENLPEEEGWMDNFHGPQNQSMTRIMLPNQYTVRYKSTNEAEPEAAPSVESSEKSATNEPKSPAAKDSSRCPNEPFTLREFEIW